MAASACGIVRGVLVGPSHETVTLTLGLLNFAVSGPVPDHGLASPRRPDAGPSAIRDTDQQDASVRTRARVLGRGRRAGIRRDRHSDLHGVPALACTGEPPSRAQEGWCPTEP